MSKRNNNIFKSLVVSTKCKEYDWAGFKVTKDNKLTCHHIFKRVYGVIDSVDNYAILTEISHVLLHKLEHENRKLYNEINKDLSEVDRTKELSMEDRIRIKTKLLRGKGSD